MELEDLLAHPAGLDQREIDAYEAELETLLAPLDPELQRWTYNGEQMMDRFLERTGLSDDLVLSKTTEMAALRNERKRLEERRQNILKGIQELRDKQADLELKNISIAEKMATSSEPEKFVEPVQAISLELDLIATGIVEQQKKILEEIEPRLATLEERYRALRS